ncbi:hypothetical protein AMATHDRAFT_150027 [Amanita thiersii Skay4041]|uniref:Uncharacterized protein n=1 Tax=Amanita thiersii Skay4041 TaxID=703135 RepID=A0A2A9NJE0_9AGAR|nr:hypothetical protein AMATHDRAFT_150027 [Amanita thiersii Skay4041]
MPSLKQLLLLLSTSWLSNCFSNSTPPDPNTLPSAGPTCFDTAKTLDEYTFCNWKHVVLPEAWTSQSYAAAQPTPDQREAWSIAVASLLNTDKNCTSIVLPHALKDIYHIVELTEPSNQSFCIFSEIYRGNNGTDHNYKKGWGLLVVPSTREAVSRFVHLSAPFPQASINSTEQATAVFKGIGAKSLYISGRNHRTFMQPSTCIMSTSNTTYYKTDAAHDNNELFLDTSIQIMNWQKVNGGCAAASCAYIEVLGKAESSCKDDEVFISAGIDNGSGWYTRHQDYPGRRIRDNLAKKYPKWKFSLPSDSTCDFVGTKDIIGRMLNGVNVSRVCTQDASPGNTKGEFVQLEESPTMRQSKYHQVWIDVLRESFTPVCADGMDVDEINMCIE